MRTPIMQTLSVQTSIGQASTAKPCGPTRFKQHLLFRSLLLASALSVCTGADAQKTLEEIVVTAQKRVQSLQDVPAAVSAIAGESVRDFLGAGENIRALAGRVPSLQVESSNGRQSPRFYIRGLGNYDFDVNATQPVSLILDEVALENSVLKSLPLFDVERVEVLKGPQGTLFGRSTTAGVVKIDTVKPRYETDGYVKAGYGSRGTISTEGAVGGGIGRDVAARLSLKYLDRDAWIDNTVNGGGDDFGGFDELSYRLQFLWTPNDAATVLFKLHGFHQDGDHPQIFYANGFTPGREGLRPGFDEEVVSQDGVSGFDLDHIGGSAKVEYEFDAVKFTSISAYDTVESFSRTDLDGGLVGGPEVIGELGRQAFFNASSGDGLSDHFQFTQEFRLSGEQQNLFYQVGLFYLAEDITVDSNDFATPSGVSTALTQAEQETTSAAVFGQVEYALNDDLSVTGGLRFTRDDKELEVIPGPGATVPAASIDADDDYVSWELALNYDYSDNVSLYSRLGTASRGPVTLGRFGFTSQADTETITSFEVGFKSSLFDGRARWNATIYAYEIDDQQLTATGGTGNTNELLNADKTEGSGFETDFEALITEHLRVAFNLSYNDTEIKDSNLNVELCSSTPLCTPKDPIVDTFDGRFGTVNLVSVDGNPLPRAPEWLYNISAHYDYPLATGTLYASTDWNYRSESNIFLYESVEFVAEERWIGGLRVGYKNVDDNLDIALVGRNITDEIVADGAIDFLNMTAFVNEPRFWGVEAIYSF
ncbi:TonB-dependent receptor [Exilibacterium tricleocarpae]|uniref:TonB-dependent receptor n=1 Tax=Exilibacterium tricleocarpae TaxID=2591008 RepID=A0A545U9R6_9GAMM|nr:TonB-dependent receptor [Exilibacterium tricleocarpae]TQV86212.1 TonB-dependent receptor [Exilibacterium tricleocarpae]